MSIAVVTAKARLISRSPRKGMTIDRTGPKHDTQPFETTGARCDRADAACAVVSAQRLHSALKPVVAVMPAPVVLRSVTIRSSAGPSGEKLSGNVSVNA